jgi:hypothetical protein
MAGSSKSGSDLDKLVEKCLHDAAFRDLLQSDPGAALRQLNIWTQHREEVIKQKLTGAYPSLQSVADAFGHGKQFAN